MMKNEAIDGAVTNIKPVKSFVILIDSDISCARNKKQLWFETGKNWEWRKKKKMNGRLSTVGIYSETCTQML